MTVTVKVPVVVNVHESVAVPDPVTLVGVTVHAVLFAESATMPLKPLTPATVMVDVAAAPFNAVTLVGDAEIVKSWTVNVTVAECDRVPLVPVTVTV